MKQDRSRPKPRYAHSLARMDSRVFLFGGETNTGAALSLLLHISARHAALTLSGMLF